MAEVSIMIGGRRYQIACDDGQEDRVLTLASRIEAEAQGLGGSGNISEPRLLLMSALMLADKLDDAEQALQSNPEGAPSPAPAVVDDGLLEAAQSAAAEAAADAGHAIESIQATIAKLTTLASPSEPSPQPEPSGPADNEGGDEGEGRTEVNDAPENAANDDLTPRQRRMLRRRAQWNQASGN